MTQYLCAMLWFFFKQIITTGKRLLIAYGCALEVQRTQRTPPLTSHTEGLRQDKKEETLQFLPIVTFLLDFLLPDKTLQPNLPFFWNRVLNAVWGVSSQICLVSVQINFSTPVGGKGACVLNKHDNTKLIPFL